MPGSWDEFGDGKRADELKAHFPTETDNFFLPNGWHFYKRSKGRQWLSIQNSDEEPFRKPE